MHYSWITRQASSVYVLSCLFIFIVDLLWNKRRRCGRLHASWMLVAALSTNQCIKNTNFIPISVFTVSEFDPVCYKSHLYTGGKRDTSLYRPGFTPKRASNCLHVVLESSCGTDSTRARCSVVNKLEVSRHTYRGWWWWRWGCCWWNFGRVHQIHQCFCWSGVSFKGQPHTHTHTQLFPVSMLS